MVCGPPFVIVPWLLALCTENVRAGLSTSLGSAGTYGIWHFFAHYFSME